MEKQAQLVPRRDRRQDDSADAQRAMARRTGAKAIEAAGSHAIYVSQPEIVAELITQAAEGSR